MKKVVAVILSVAMVFALAACGKDNTAEKYCFNCGEGITKDAAFCEHCGTNVGGAKTESEDTSTTTESTESKPTATSEPSTSSEPTTSSGATESSKPTETSMPSTPTHTHSYSKKVTAATCAAQGYTTYTCSCGDTYKDNYTNPSHSYTKYKCTKCGTVDKSHAYEYLMEWVKDNGTSYGGYTEYKYNTGNSTYSLCYSAQYDSLSLSVTGTYNGKFTHSSLYLDSYYYGCTFDDLEMCGYINASTFTTNTAITYNRYTGDSQLKAVMMELSRANVCDLVEWCRWFLDAYDMGITIKDLGFASY